MTKLVAKSAAACYARRMKIAADLLEVGPPPLAKVPAWARSRGEVQRDVDASYLAGAALNSLDNLVCSGPAWAGVWRQRLALKSAAAATRLLGRRKSRRCATRTSFAPRETIQAPQERCCWPGAAWEAGRQRSTKRWCDPSPTCSSSMG